MDDPNTRRGRSEGGVRRRRIGDSVGGGGCEWVFEDENGGGESRVAVKELSDEFDGGDEVAHSRGGDENQFRRRHVGRME